MPGRLNHTAVYAAIRALRRGEPAQVDGREFRSFNPAEFGLCAGTRTAVVLCKIKNRIRIVEAVWKEFGDRPVIAGGGYLSPQKIYGVQTLVAES